MAELYLFSYKLIHIEKYLLSFLDLYNCIAVAGGHVAAAVGQGWRVPAFLRRQPPPCLFAGQDGAGVLHRSTRLFSLSA